MSGNWVLRESKKTDGKKDSDFYHIKFQSGKGAGWGLHGREYAEDRIRDVVDTNVRMYEFTKGGVMLPRDLGEFLSLACGVYEHFNKGYKARIPRAGTQDMKKGFQQVDYSNWSCCEHVSVSRSWPLRFDISVVSY